MIDVQARLRANGLCYVSPADQIVGVYYMDTERCRRLVGPPTLLIESNPYRLPKHPSYFVSFDGLRLEEWQSKLKYNSDRTKYYDSLWDKWMDRLEDEWEPMECVKWLFSFQDVLKGEWDRV